MAVIVFRTGARGGGNDDADEVPEGGYANVDGVERADTHPNMPTKVNDVFYKCRHSFV